MTTVSNVTPLPSVPTNTRVLIRDLQQQHLQLPRSMTSRVVRIETSGGASQWEIRGALSPDERSTLELWEMKARSVLSSATEAEVAQAIKPLFLAFPMAGNQSPNEAGARAKIYLTALGGLPQWAISDVVEDYCKGMIVRDTHTFMPSPPEVVREVRQRTRAYELFAWEIRKTLEAKPVEVLTDEQMAERRERVARLLRSSFHAG